MQRRRFLKDAAIGTASTATALAFSLSQGVGQSPPSERIRVGFVGIGHRAFKLLDQFSSQKDVEVVALADIDQGKFPEAVKLLESRQKNVPAIHEDFRHLVDDRSIDALVVGTPDHWHAIPTIMACQAGKDVYVEKPDGHNIVEGQRMVSAMRKHKRIVQMGTQARSDPGFFELMDYIRSGKLGRVLVAKSWENTLQLPVRRIADAEVPAGVNYDLWLGPAPKRPFNPSRFHGNWRWFFDYGSGDLGNDGVHRIDYARWALDTALEAQGEPPLGLPSKISTVGGKWYFDDVQEWPDTLQANFEYRRSEDGSSGIIQTYEMRVWTPYNYQGEGDGMAIFGDQGYVIVGSRRWRAYGKKNKRVAEGKSGLTDALPHVRNFLDCVKSRKRPNADLETVGHPSSLLCHTANIAWRTGRQLTLDPKTERFIGDEQANALCTRPEYRKPWTLPEV